MFFTRFYSPWKLSRKNKTCPQKNDISPLVFLGSEIFKNMISKYLFLDFPRIFCSSRMIQHLKWVKAKYYSRIQKFIWKVLAVKRITTGLVRRMSSSMVIRHFKGYLYAIIQYVHVLKHSAKKLKGTFVNIFNIAIIADYGKRPF